jgi:hypothetical protein
MIRYFSFHWHNSDGVKGWAAQLQHAKYSRVDYISNTFTHYTRYSLFESIHSVIPPITRLPKSTLIQNHNTALIVADTLEVNSHHITVLRDNPVQV